MHQPLCNEVCHLSCCADLFSASVVYAWTHALNVLGTSPGKQLLQLFSFGSPLVKLLVRPDRSIVIVIVIGGGGGGGGWRGGAPPRTISTPAARSARHTVNTADCLQHADSVCNWQTGPPPGRRGGALGGISPQRWPAEGRVSSPWAEEKIRRGRPVRVVAGQPATFGHERQICADFCCSMIQLRDFAISDSGALLEHALLHRGPTPLNTRATRLHMLFHPRSQ